MRIISYIVLLILLFLGITFACLNYKPVIIHYFIGQSHVALSLLLVAAFAIGGVLGLIVSMAVIVRQKAENLRLKHKLKKATA